jgi:KaiC/GvpD/RAD55 family RecA-like ATPase
VFRAALNNKRATGVQGLDAVLDGGFPVGTTIIIMGSPLSGIDLMARQFWKLDEETGTYLMIDTEVEEGMTDARNLSPDQFPQLYAGHRIIIDSLSSIILHHGIEAALRCMATARAETAHTDSNIMFVFYTGIHKPEEEILTLRMVDVVLELKQVVFVTEIERQLAVHKVKNNQVPKRLIPFNITEKGIELSTTSRVV